MLFHAIKADKLLESSTKLAEYPNIGVKASKAVCLGSTYHSSGYVGYMLLSVSKNCCTDLSYLSMKSFSAVVPVIEFV